jgi:tetratricopeptide (TPR) repeat protein
VHLFQHKQQLIFGLTTIAFVGYGLGEFPLERATLLIPFGVALGYLSATSKVLLSTTKLPGFVLTSVLLIYSVFISYSRINGEKDASRTLDGYQEWMNKSPLLNEYQKRLIIQKMMQYSSSAQSPYFEMDTYNYPMPYWEGLGILMQAGQNPSSSALNKCAAKFQEALEIHPNHILSLNQMGQIRRIEGKLTEAHDYYDQVLSMSPRNTSAALRLIEIRRLQGDIYGSLDALKMIDPKYTNTWPMRSPEERIAELYKEEGGKTLQSFASIPNPRAASKELHSKLQGQKPGAMWQTWVEFRKK